MKKKPNWFFPSPTFFRGIPTRLRFFWRKFYESTQHGMTRGAENISKIISFAHKDNWRRGREKKKPPRS